MNFPVAITAKAPNVPDATFRTKRLRSTLAAMAAEAFSIMLLMVAPFIGLAVRGVRGIEIKVAVTQP